MQLSQFRTALQQRLAESSIGTATFYTTTILNDFINQAEREIAKLGEAYERSTSIAAVIDRNAYRFPTDFYLLQNVSFMNSNYEYKLEYRDIREAMMLYNHATSTLIPRYFSIWGHTRSHQMLYLFPKPSTTFTEINAPGVATLAETASGSLDSTAAYAYRVTFYTEYGETDGGTSATLTLTGTNRTISLSSIPTTTDTNVIGRRIYRTEGGGSVYFFLTQIADRSTTTTYSDGNADSVLGPELVDENTANNIRLYYNAIPETALSADADTPRVPTPDYDESILAYCMYLAKVRDGNMRDAQFWLANFQNQVQEAKGDTATKHNVHFVNIFDNSRQSYGRRGYNFTWPIVAS